MRYLALLGVLVAMLVCAGCATFTAARGTEGKAHVVKATPFGSSFWNCEATGGKPKCYKVIKQ